MKTATIVLALVALGCAAPQPKKVFHENFQDFMDVIMEEAGSEIEHLMEHYIEYEEFWATLNYMRTSNFKDLVFEMESLPEFRAVIEFLENDNIDIMFFLDMFNDAIGAIDAKRNSRHETSGRDFNSFVADSIAAFPKEKLAALYEEKMAEDEEFRVAMENLQSEEWDQVFTALWENEVFKAEVQTLADNGIDLSLLLAEIMAIFGQN